MLEKESSNKRNIYELWRRNKPWESDRVLDLYEAIKEVDPNLDNALTPEKAEELIRAGEQKISS